MNTDDHSRTIVHVDLDCFYAQVEILKNPHLSDVPLGIQQKNIVVTCNYKAREYGVKKCMLLTEALEKCPELVLVNGEDLNDYRTMSYKVTNLLQKYTENVERLGLDENFVDVTKLVEERQRNEPIQHIGHVFGTTEDLCQCGCEGRIKLASLIADEIRRKIREELGLTSCAGIAHNKLLAKIVCSKHKPNQQTLIYPNSAVELMLSLKSIENIPGIGRATGELLRNYGIRTIQDMHNADINVLNKLFDVDKAKFLQCLSYGVDNTPVKRSGKPQSIGLEDSCKSISAEKEVKEKLTELLTRLLILVHADGRVPKTIKLTVRKFDKSTKTSRRETKQSNINPHLFTDQHVNPERIIPIIMNLFRKLVQVRKPFHITLLGLSFTKFNERPDVRNTIASFIRKHLEVQSVTSIENLTGESSPESTTAPSPTSTTAPSPSSCDADSCEPTPKRTKLNVFRMNFMEYDTCESPCKLRVQDLHLTSDRRDNNQNIKCPPNADEGVFKELPVEVQQELWNDYKRGGGSFNRTTVKKAKGNNLLNYFVKK